MLTIPAVNVMGFVAYLIYNCAMAYSPLVRQEYAARNHGLTPTVELNDGEYPLLIENSISSAGYIRARIKIGNIQGFGDRNRETLETN